MNFHTTSLVLLAASMSHVAAVTTINTWSSGSDSNTAPVGPANIGATQVFVGSGIVNNVAASTLYLRATVVSTNVNVLFPSNNAATSFDVILQPALGATLADRRATIRYDLFADAALTVPLSVDRLFVLSDDIDLAASRREAIEIGEGLTFVSLETPTNIVRPSAMRFQGGADQNAGELSGAVGLVSQNSTGFTVTYATDQLTGGPNSRYFHRTDSQQPFDNPLIIPVPEPAPLSIFAACSGVLLMFRRRH